ncbi:MAG: hypothetical protein Q4B42_04470, partial [Oscillospiraceae bacterium]|nr:hypothetical protein [Oscillospiraceae bacterium]
MPVQFSEMWPEFEGARGLEIRSLKVDRGANAMSLALFCERFSPSLLRELRAFFSEEYPELKASLSCVFPKEQLSEAACRFLIEELALGGMPLNGFFEGALIESSEREVDIELAHGGRAILEKLGFEAAFRDICLRCFGAELKVRLRERENAGAPGLPEELKPACAASPETDYLGRRLRSGALPLTSKEAQSLGEELEEASYVRVMGDKPSFSAIKPLGKAADAPGRCVVKGEVFNIEKRETRKGALIVTASISD